MSRILPGEPRLKGETFATDWRRAVTHVHNASLSHIELQFGKKVAPITEAVADAIISDNKIDCTLFGQQGPYEY